MAKENTNIYLDAELKKQCQELFDDLGMDLTTAVTIFLKQSLRSQGLPFQVSRDVPNAETLAAFEEFEAIKNNPNEYKRYNSFADAMKDVLGDA